MTVIQQNKYVLCVYKVPTHIRAEYERLNGWLTVLVHVCIISLSVYLFYPSVFSKTEWPGECDDCSQKQSETAGQDHDRGQVATDYDL